VSLNDNVNNYDSRGPRAHVRMRAKKIDETWQFVELAEISLVVGTQP